MISLLTRIGVAGLANFGIGSPRRMPPILAVIRYILALLNPWGHGYAEKQGRIQTRRAIARNCLKTLGVVLNESQILLLEGSKPAIRYVLQTLRLYGEVALPHPYYPGNLDGVLGAGCRPVHIPMPSVKDFILNLEQRLLGGFRPVAVVLSFDNPQWLERTIEDYSRLVELARRYRFVLLSDEAYRDLSYNGLVASVMQVPGWEKLAVCIQTASKPFCAAGWKLGALITASERLDGMVTTKGTDSEGGSPAAQKAYETALGCTWYPRHLAQTYHKRARFTVGLLKKITGVEAVSVSAGGMFVYFKIKGMDAQSFYSALKANGFEVSPGNRFGEPDHIRWCLNQPDWVTRRAVRAVELVFEASRGEQAA